MGLISRAIVYVTHARCIQVLEATGHLRLDADDDRGGEGLGEPPSLPGFYHVTVGALREAPTSDDRLTLKSWLDRSYQDIVWVRVARGQELATCRTLAHAAPNGSAVELDDGPECQDCGQAGVVREGCCDNCRAPECQDCGQPGVVRGGYVLCTWCCNNRGYDALLTNAEWADKCRKRGWVE